MYPSVRELGVTGEEFATGLLRAEKVAAVPGDAFGEAGKYHIRCSYATSMANLDEANRAHRPLCAADPRLSAGVGGRRGAWPGRIGKSGAARALLFARPRTPVCPPRARRLLPAKGANRRGFLLASRYNLTKRRPLLYNR